MVYNIIFNLHKSNMIYSNDRIDAHKFLLKSHISKKITVIQNSSSNIVSIANHDMTIKYNIQTITLITFFNNRLILLEVLDICGMIQP